MFDGMKGMTRRSTRILALACAAGSAVLAAPTWALSMREFDRPPYLNGAAPDTGRVVHLPVRFERDPGRLVAHGAHGRFGQTDQTCRGGLDGVVVMAHQALGLPYRVEDGFLGAGIEELCLAHVTLCAHIVDLRHAGRRGAMTAVAGVAGRC